MGVGLPGTVKLLMPPVVPLGSVVLSSRLPLVGVLAGVESVMLPVLSGVAASAQGQQNQALHLPEH